MNIDDLKTPALVLDLDILERNLVWMQRKADRLHVALRPHIKTHKCIEIGKRQRELGARGITVSTFFEAQRFAENGFDDITWAFPLPPVFAAAALDLAQETKFRVVVDSLEARDALRDVCRTRKERIHVWLKVDCGYHRAGVDPQSRFAEELLRSLVDSDLLLFDGILSHSGHAYVGPSRHEILAAANQERSVMSDFAERMRNKGLSVPAVSVGSTPSMVVIEQLDGVSEVRPGNYAFFDQTMVALDVCSCGDCAVTVLASVISHQPGASHFLTDAGALALSKDSGHARVADTMGMGSIYRDYTQKSLHAGLRMKTLSQEHGKVVADNPELLNGRFSVGQRVRILENHSCLTVAHFDEYHVVRGDEVVDRWPILRGRV